MKTCGRQRRIGQIKFSINLKKRGSLSKKIKDVNCPPFFPLRRILFLSATGNMCGKIGLC